MGVGGGVCTAVGTSNLVEGGQTYISLAYTRVLLDRLKNGGSVKPHKILVEEVWLGQRSSTKSRRTRSSWEVPGGTAENLGEEEKNTDDGSLSEITADRPVLPELGVQVQTRAAEGEEWSEAAIVVKVGSFLDRSGKGGFREQPEKVPRSAPAEPPDPALVRVCRAAATLVSAGGKPRPLFFMTRGK